MTVHRLLLLALSGIGAFAAACGSTSGGSDSLAGGGSKSDGGQILGSSVGATHTGGYDAGKENSLDGGTEIADSGADADADGAAESPCALHSGVYLTHYTKEPNS